MGKAYLRPAPILLTVGAAIPPLVLIPTGADQRLRVWSQSSLGGSYRPGSASVLMPYVVGGLIAGSYVVGLATEGCSDKPRPLLRASSAMIQGMASTWAVAAAFKWITGRAWPNGGRDPAEKDRLEHPEDARDFAPFRRGLAAFPSGHTAVMFAASASFREATGGSWWSYALYPLAAGVGVGMWMQDHHWASEVLSGALLGEALGSAAGRAWRAPNHERNSEQAVNWTILGIPRGLGAGLSGRFD